MDDIAKQFLMSSYRYWHIGRRVRMLLCVGGLALVLLVAVRSTASIRPHTIPFRRSSTHRSLEAEVEWPPHWRLLLQHAHALQLVLVDAAPLGCLRSPEALERRKACAALKSNHVLRFGTVHTDFQLFMDILNSTVLTNTPELTLRTVVPAGNADSVLLDYRHPSNFAKVLVVTWLSRPDSAHFHLLRGEAETPTLAVPKFPTAAIALFDDETTVLVPLNVERHLLALRHGRFVECNGSVSRNENLKSDRGLSPMTADSLAEFVELLLQTGQVPMLAYGSLLGWWRNCSFVPSVPDVDFLVEAEEYAEAFEEAYIGHPRFPLANKVGVQEHGLELSFWLPRASGAPAMVDLFYVYNHNASTQWTSLHFDMGTKSRKKNLFPRILEKCSASVGGWLFFVPCNFEELLEANYGGNSMDGSENLTETPIKNGFNQNNSSLSF